jgi:hypothetical protein
MQSTSRSRSARSKTNNLGIGVALALLLLFALGCGTNDGPTAEELMDGIPMDPADYEINNFQCNKLEDRISLTFDLTNLDDEFRNYQIRYTFTKADGTAFTATNIMQAAQPGETIEFSTWIGNPQDYNDPPDCDAEILLSIAEAYR